MAHERTEIRNAIVAQLKGPGNNRTAAGARVVKSRLAPPKTASLPFVSVYNELEPIKEGGDKGSRELERQYEVTICGWVIAASDSDVDDALDALALEIETAMDLDHTLDSYASTSHLVNTQFGIDLSGERPLGAVSLTYGCTYFSKTRNAAPVDNFDTASAVTDLGGEQATLDETAVLVEDINAG